MNRLLILILIVLATSLVNAQQSCANKTYVPKEFYHNRYQPVDAIQSRPFTMFNEPKPNHGLNVELSTIRNNIKSPLNNKGFAILYKQIYLEAIKNKPGKCMIDQEECPHPIWVKNNI